jgi:ribonuclease D
MSDHQSVPITTGEGLGELSRALRAAGRFAFDTEFVSEDTYEPVLGLIQVATDDVLAAIDPLAVGDLGPFWDVLLDPAIEVVTHAAGEDLRIVLGRTGRLPSRVVDVQIAAGLVGPTYPLSLNNLVRQSLGITLAGGETRTDWRRRPLTPSQLRYALDDVRHLLEIADRLEAQLQQLGRLEWAEDEYADLLIQVTERTTDTDRWRRLPGLHQLSRRGLELARRLDGWRRNEARRVDRPVRQVLRDDLLVGIAKRAPTTKRDLEALRDFNRPQLLSRSREFLDLINEGLAVPDADLPPHAERHDDGPGLSMVVSLLSATLNQACGERKVAASLVGTVADLKDLVRWHVDGRPDASRPALARGWRAEVCGQDLADVISGRRSLRIVDPTADVPVALDPIDPNR